jgi:hypothetical protein
LINLIISIYLKTEQLPTMNNFQPNRPIQPQPARDTQPRRLIVTTSVVIFAIRDWSLWVLLRDGPWGPPMRVVMAHETLTEAVTRVMEALLIWHEAAELVQLKAGWQEQQVSVWNSNEEGAAVSLIHSILLRANRDELQPNLHRQPVPSLRVRWVSIAEVEAGRYPLDPQIAPVLQSALDALRAQIQRDPVVALRYLADMASMRTAPVDHVWWARDGQNFAERQTLPMEALRAPEPGDGILTLAEAALLYKAPSLPDHRKPDTSQRTTPGSWSRTRLATCQQSLSLPRKRENNLISPCAIISSSCLI